MIVEPTHGPLPGKPPVPGRSALSTRPRSGQLTVPFVVDEHRVPIDFRQLDPLHVRACADRRLCGICGERIQIYERLAFIGPLTLLDRSCFADPWMHEDCAHLAMEQCPFLNAKKAWREPLSDDRADKLIEPYARAMTLRTSPAGRAHKDAIGGWHFEALGPLVATE